MTRVYRDARTGAPIAPPRAAPPAVLSYRRRAIATAATLESGATILALLVALCAVLIATPA